MGDNTEASRAAPRGGTSSDSASRDGASLSSDSLAAPVELYIERLSPPCRVVWLYLLQNNIHHVLIDVNFKNADKCCEFMKRYPHKEVPVLVDGSMIVFEAPAILSYLAVQYTSYAGFGLSLQTRFQVESLLSWANAELHRSAGYNFAYPSCLDKYRLQSEKANEELIEYGMRHLAKQLECLETGYLKHHQFLTGDRLTVADSFVATVILQAQWNGFRFQMWPKVERWLRLVRAQEFWSQVHRVHNELVRELEEQPFEFD